MINGYTTPRAGGPRCVLPPQCRNRAVAPIALFVLMLPACRTTPTADPTTTNVNADDTPGLTIIDRSEPAQSVTASEIYQAKEHTQRYRITAGDKDGAIVRRETAETDRFGAGWVTVETLLDDGEVVRATRYWSFTDDHAVVLHASIDHDDNAISLFKPPLIIAYPKLRPGDSMKQETRIRVVAEDDPVRGKERGTARQIAVCDGVYTMRTPIGEVTAHRIIIEFEADLSMADATERTEMYVSAEHGIVAERRTRSVKVLGMQGSEHHETVVLAAPN